MLHVVVEGLREDEPDIVAIDGKTSHIKPYHAEFSSGGLHDLFLYRDLGIAKATGGRVLLSL